MNERRVLYAPTESEIQRAILDYLTSIGAVAIRVNSGVHIIQDSNGSTRAFHGAPAGTSDIIACYRGRYVAIECKARRGKTTPAQEDFINRVIEAGGVAFVARSVDDVETQLGEIT